MEILKRCDKDFPVYSGDDATSLELMMNGAKGVISVTANVAPRKMHTMCDAGLAGDKALAEKINAKLMPLHNKLFLEANPIPTKWVWFQPGYVYQCPPWTQNFIRNCGKH